MVALKGSRASRPWLFDTLILFSNNIFRRNVIFIFQTTIFTKEHKIYSQNYKMWLKLVPFHKHFYPEIPSHLESQVSGLGEEERLSHHLHNITTPLPAPPQPGASPPQYRMNHEHHKFSIGMASAWNDWKQLVKPIPSKCNKTFVYNNAIWYFNKFHGFIIIVQFYAPLKLYSFGSAI